MTPSVIAVILNGIYYCICRKCLKLKTKYVLSTKVKTSYTYYELNVCLKNLRDRDNLSKLIYHPFADIMSQTPLHTKST